MYKFIMNDLDKAEAALADYDRDEDDKDKPDINVVYGLKARLWLEMASRFDQNADDLAAQVSHDADDDGYSPLGITSAADCYAKAAEYARKAITSGEFSPVTKDQWFDKNEAFNTANQVDVESMPRLEEPNRLLVLLVDGLRQFRVVQVHVGALLRTHLWRQLFGVPLHRLVPLLPDFRRRLAQEDL